jgi:ribosomal protein S18 acetylase RimI-like enzyme
MSEITGDLDSFAVDPRLYAPLKRFSCGKGGSRAEREVNQMAREYAAGKRKCDGFRVTVERPAELAGIAAYQGVQIPRIGSLVQAYISVIGVSEDFRGRKKGSARLGDFVLMDVLGAIGVDSRWGPSPPVFALVDPNNEPSCALFRRHGFQVVIPAEPDNPEADSLFGRA